MKKPNIFNYSNYTIKKEISGNQYKFFSKRYHVMVRPIFSLNDFKLNPKFLLKKLRCYSTTKNVIVGSLILLLFALLPLDVTFAIQAPQNFRIQTTEPSNKIRVILDTDANNELDDQHAITYMLFNSDIFEIEGITVNRTSSGGEIDNHYAEADRVVKMCGYTSLVNTYKGASGSYDSIKGNINNQTFDGSEAVNFIIQRANTTSLRPLILLPIGKLTNIALALLKDPSIAPKIRIVWLGSNWPYPGEYNLDNDTTAVNPILEMPDVDFEIATVRYGATSGTSAVQVSLIDIQQNMPGLGPQISPPIPGRSGGTFSNFGDYSVDLFNSAGNSSRALYDMAAVAIVKNPLWAEKVIVPAPRLSGNSWIEQNNNPRKIIFWENFNKYEIIEDLFETMRNPN
jgi:inosine-uridine nucleoside N-ribohydrolase